MSSRTSTWFRFEIALGGLAVAAALTGCASFASEPSVEGTALAPPPLRRAFLVDSRAEAYQHFVVAQLKARAGQFPDAITELREAIKYDPSTAALWIQLSQWLARTNDVPQAQEAAQNAIAALKQAVDMDPDMDAAWSALGFVYESRNQLEDAIKVYKQAIKANPDNMGFIERLGDLLAKLGRYKEAQEEVEALVDSLPRDPRVWLKLGALHYEQKQWDKAVSAFRQAVLL